ncbi:hypothetical protein [Nocardioides humi]|uniref:ParB-like nuclease domain-containing protein n=1 Tax=Nocardioides humi TaxID=449461 RepID=A0ABN2BLT5_9ACTN|nr:hypothetical protein [Nocardioides humi]
MPDDQSADHADRPDVEIVEVTPQIAETWLSRNPNNRNLRRPVVDSYARDIEAGRWRLNGETVKFGPGGVLLDGQHRLSAVVQAGTSVPMVVVRNLGGDVMATVDTGAKRSYADALKLAGEENTTTLAAVVRRAVMWERGMRTNTGAIKPTALEMDDFLDRHPEIRASADLASRLASRETLPASVFGLCHHLFVRLDPEQADLFLMRVADGDEVPKEHPIAQLRRRITLLRVRGGRINETEGLALAIQTWNTVRAGHTRLRMPQALTNDNFPVPQ